VHRSPGTGCHTGWQISSLATASWATEREMEGEEARLRLCCRNSVVGRRACASSALRHAVGQGTDRSWLRPQTDTNSTTLELRHLKISWVFSLLSALFFLGTTTYMMQSIMMRAVRVLNAKSGGIGVA
jgi:hypothetical protein